MIADLKPYAEYKESGLPWLGQVPGHWGVRRMKLLLREVDSLDGLKITDAMDLHFKRLFSFVFHATAARNQRVTGC